MRDWSTLGPKLEGKLHLAVGDSDTYFLNNAVYLLQENFRKTRNPHSDATFDFGHVSRTAIRERGRTGMRAKERI